MCIFRNGGLGNGTKHAEKKNVFFFFSATHTHTHKEHSPCFEHKLLFFRKIEKPQNEKRKKFMGSTKTK